MRKRIVNKLIRDEKGQALILVVILMLFGSLITASLLGYMGTGLKVGKAFEVKMEGLYAADAGMENACWKLLNGETPEVDPFCDLTDVNGMHVTVDEHAPPVPTPTGDGTIYTLKSTAELAGEPEADIIAKIEVTGGSVAEGGEGGDYSTNEEMAALSVLNEYTIIFATQNKSLFWGREDKPGPGTEIEPEDLGLLNIAAGTGALFLNGDEVGLLGNPKYEFNSAHYYHDEVTGNDYLLMSIKTNAYVGPFRFNDNDIIRLQVDVSDDPVHPSIQSVISVDLFDTLDADIVALTARGLGDDDPTNDSIFFSISGESADLGGTEYHRGEIIKFNPNTGVYSLAVDTNAILEDIPGQPVLKLDCLAIMPESDDLRLLLSFSADAGVEGTDGVEIQAEDVAIWNPADNTIILHISMSIETWVPGAERTVSIISWEVSP